MFNELFKDKKENNEELTKEQKEEIKKGNYDPWNFEEEELEDDDYYFDDDKEE
jgi:hypothetical protein